MENGHYDKVDGKHYRYKVVWWENEEDQPCTAFGTEWHCSGSAIVFEGKMGEIVFSPSIKFVIK